MAVQLNPFSALNGPLIAVAALLGMLLGFWLRGMF